jgi:hypothetical protein
MKHIGRILGILLVIQIAILFYSHRANLASVFDAQYWKDRYEHSQWRLPLSPRTIGDNGLYAYEGYLFIHGADPTLYNAEIPPLGKYAIGAITQLFGNGVWYGAISGLVVLLLFYVLANKLLHNATLALAATTWLAFDPLFTSQWDATMLDTLHLACLLLFFILLFECDKHKDTVLVTTLTGAALGIFSAVKYPILSVILAVWAIYYFRHKKHSLVPIVTFLFSAGVIYIISYIRYFLIGHTLINWMGVQKWMFSFYVHSKLEANIGSIWTTLLAGRYQNLFTKQWQYVPEWSITWPISTAISLYVTYLLVRENKPFVVKIMAISILCITIFYSITTFWTRYLTIIVPFLYIGAAAAVNKIKRTWLTLVLIFCIVIANGYASWRNLFPTPVSEVTQFIYDWENGFFQDMYERFTISTKAKLSRYTFHRNMQQIVRDGEIESTNITIAHMSWSRATSPQYVTLNITYSTRYLGEFYQQTILPVILENGAWRIPWKQNFFLSGLSEGNILTTTVIEGKRGAIIDPNVGVIAEDVPGLLIWITPKNVDTTKEQAMLKYLEKLFGYPRFSSISFYHRYITNSQPDWPVPVAVIAKPAGDTELTALTAFPGITLTPALGRFSKNDYPVAVGIVTNTHYHECCSYLYTTTTYDGTSGLEKIYNSTLKGFNGGSLVITDASGQILKTLISVEKKVGEDVLLK